MTEPVLNSDQKLSLALAQRTVLIAASRATEANTALEKSKADLENVAQEIAKGFSIDVKEFVLDLDTFVFIARPKS